MDLRQWPRTHWRPVAQYTGYALIALAGFWVQPVLGLFLLGMALILLANGW